MTEKKEPKRRTQIKDLSPKEKELTKDEQKKIKGGLVEIASDAPRLKTGGGSEGVGEDFIER